MFVWMIFSESQNILLSNLVWWCSIMRQIVMWKSLFFCFVFAVFKVKVTARAHMIKIWLFLLYFLNCWFRGNQTWSDDTSSEARVSYDKIGLLLSGSRSQGRSKCSCLSRWCLLTHQTFCFQTWYCDASLGVGVSCKKHPWYNPVWLTGLHAPSN